MDWSTLFDSADLDGWTITLALAAIIAAWVLSRLASRALAKLFGAVPGLSPTLRQLVIRLVRYLILLLGVGTALGLLGAQIQPFITAAIIVAVVLVVSLRGLADNFGASVVIQVRRPIRIGELIESAGYVGVVTALNGRSVVLLTRDGRVVHLPNKEVLDQPLVNHSHSGGRRSEVEVRCTAPGPVRETTGLLVEVTAEVSGVRGEPRPQVLVRAVEPERLVASVRFWHDPSDEQQVTSAVVTRLGEQLRTRGIAATVVAPVPVQPLTPPAAV